MRKIPSEEDQTKTINEIIEIRNEILSKWLPELEIRQYPKIRLKFGGCTAYFTPFYEKLDDKVINCLVFRYDSWNVRNLFGKRVLLIHEIFHSLEQNHSAKNGYGTSFDYLSLMIYKEIWGNDVQYDNMITLNEDFLSLISSGVKYLNTRKLKILVQKSKYKII